jgi:hypothetical protein
MTKLTEKNRGLVFLAGTLVAGILVTCILMLFENNDVVRVATITNPPESNSASLENNINNLNNQNFDPASYSTLATGIDASYRQGLITIAVKATLDDRLKATYSNLVYDKCELFLISKSTSSSSDILGLLKQVEGIRARNAKIDFYRKQIDLFEYYSNVLPDKVNRFIQEGTEKFVETTYLAYKDELQTMPGFDPRYKNTPKFNQIKDGLISRLQNLYNIFSQPAPILDPNT